MQTAFVGIDVGKAGLVVATTYELNDRNEIIPPHNLSLRTIMVARAVGALPFG